jgi:hypothetical protein
MRVGQRTSSETYADFTLSRVPQGVRDSLTDEQYQAIRTALIGDDGSARHRVDIRLRVSLFFRSYYVVLFAGRDRRGSTYRLEDARLTRIPVPVLRALHLLVSIVLSVVVLVLALVAAYKIKNLLGIDVFPGFHLPDLLPFEQSLPTGAQGWT